jgi:4-carboxymuconolactone decarboxylase
MGKDVYERGLSIRKRVVGESYVERSLANADEFSGPFQDLVTEYCWGAVWGREGVLDHRTRSMLNIAMLAALPRPHELKLHIQGALRNGVTTDEIREILLQATVYAGVPIGVDSFRIAREAIAEFDPES